MTTPFGSPHLSEDESFSPSPEALSPFSGEEPEDAPRRAPISPAESEYSGLRSEEKVPKVVCISPCAL